MLGQGLCLELVIKSFVIKKKTSDRHVSAVCRALTTHGRATRIGPIVWRLLPLDAAKAFASSIASSRLDCCDCSLSYLYCRNLRIGRLRSNRIFSTPTNVNN